MFALKVISLNDCYVTRGYNYISSDELLPYFCFKSLQSAESRSRLIKENDGIATEIIHVDSLPEEDGIPF